MQRTDPACEPTSPPQPEMAQLAQRIAALEAENLRLRASVMQRDSALAFARQDQAALAAAVPGLRRRAELARRVETLGERLQSLMREQPPVRRAAMVVEAPAAA